MSSTRKRVVTGLNAEGKSTITATGPAPAIFEYDGWGMEEHWAIERMPPPLDETTNAAERPEYLLQPAGGQARCRIVRFAPHSGFPMHVTATLDFLVVLTGELRLIMEDGEVVLQPGDTVVQRGTLHAWANDGDVECLVAGVLISSLDDTASPITA
jgi:quercetin dioxygenase-like cupin family protein